MSLPVSGGTPPYHWSLTGGELPAGLVLNSTNGMIKGTPRAAASGVTLTFEVRDSGDQVASSSLSLNIAESTAAWVGLGASHLAVVSGQQLSLRASTSDPAGVSWSITPDGGGFSPVSGASGDSVTFTAPTAPGVYTVTATGISDGSTASSMTVAVTDLAGVYTYHNDLSRSGANTQEYLLTPGNVRAGSFGKLFSCTVDGAIYAQPLWVPNVSIDGVRHNVVLVATEHDSLFAFDADRGPCRLLWKASLIDQAHGVTGAAEVPVVSAGPGAVVGVGNGDLSPETGVTGTPVIDPATGIVYVVSKSMDAATTGRSFHQRLHAIDLASGAEKSGSPVTIDATYPGTGDGAATVTFNPKTELQRAGLALVRGSVILTWASHEDATPYYGWVLAYTYQSGAFTRSHVLNVTPDSGYGGIWMSGAAPAADESGSLYLLTGNGRFNANVAGPAANSDYGDSLLQISGSLAVTQYFTPSDQALGVSKDLDFGAGGAALLVDLPTGSPVQHLIVGGGKDGTLYLLNRDNLGGYGDAYAWQRLSIGGPILATPAFWNNRLYIGGLGTALHAYELDAGSAQFRDASSAALTASTYRAAPTPSVSAQGTSDAIVWVVDSSSRCKISPGGGGAGGAGPAILEAFDATNLSSELWSSGINPADTAGNAVRFSVPTVANGRVYVGTGGAGADACSLTGTTGELDVYGLVQ